MNYVILGVSLAVIITTGVVFVALVGWAQYELDRDLHRNTQEGADQ
ncbi:hypothetical protein [Brevibacterium aurantiacum]|nr:hypothetical protein [Brevibacterium aurantiacum]